MAGKGGATEGAGRKEFKPTAADKAWVVNAAAVGTPQHIIRRRIFNPETGNPIAEKTLRKHFGRQIDEAFGLYALPVLTTAHSIATDRDHSHCVAMIRLIFLTRLGMKETSRHEMTGADGAPLDPPKLVIVEGNHPSQGGDPGSEE